MSRIGHCFRELKAGGRKALIPYISAGDPSALGTLKLMHALVEAGANLIELGVPFSDPMADGPVIQKASERALAGGMSLAGVLSLVRKFRATNTEVPVVLMGYLNPIEHMGYEKFAELGATAGVDGLLVVDVPPEEAGDLIKPLKAHGLDPIFLISPTTTRERVERICADAYGYLYYVSLKGVTGAGHLDTRSVANHVEVIRTVTDLPVAVGFGISDGEAAKAVAQVSDAVIVGSAIVRKVEEYGHDLEKMVEEVCRLVRSMRDRMDTPG